MGTPKRQRQKAGRQSRRVEAEIAAKKVRTRQVFLKYGAFAAVFVGLIVLFGVLRHKGSSSSAATTTTTSTSAAPTTTRAVTYGGAPCPPATVTQPLVQFDDSFMKCIDLTKSYTATFDTTEGPIKVALDTTKTPITTNNFVTLAQWRYYDNTQIFRTDTSIGILQGGSPHTQNASDPGPGYTIPDEGAGYTYKPGQLVMARASGPNSAGAQFFLVGGDQASALNSQGTYVVFGQADDAGLAVIKSILALNKDDPASGLGGKPSRTVTVRGIAISAS